MGLPEIKNFLEKFGQMALGVFSAAVAAILLIYIYIGTFTRYWADDFCFSQNLAGSANIFIATLNMYETWTNRFTTVLIVGMSEWFGRQAISYLPTVMIILWVLGLTALVNQAMRILKMPHQRLFSWLIAMLLVFFSILQAPNRFQAVYWRSGIVTYFAPLIFYAFGSAFILFQVRRWQNHRSSITMPFLTALLFFLAGGLSETTMALQIGFLSLALLAGWLTIRSENRRAVVSLLLIALAATLVSLVFVYYAPGNNVRLTSMPEHAPLPMLIITSVQFALDFISSSLKTLPIPSAVTFFSAMIISLNYFTGIGRQTPGLTRNKAYWLIIIIPLIAFALITCLIAPSVYIYREFGYPEARALFPARFVMTAAIFFDGFVAGWFAANKMWNAPYILKWLIPIAMLFAAFYPVWSAQKELATIPIYSAYAKAWDQRDESIRSFKTQNILDVTLNGIESPGSLVELNTNPRRWVNRCMAGFYKLNSIAVFLK